MSTEQFEFFWNGPFSQWHPSKFTFNNMTFNRAEQFMMFGKAVFFDDYETAKAVMKSDNPKEQKALGRKTNNFNIDKWANVAKDIVYVGNYSKFTQDEDLKSVLMATIGTTLVEASPYDKIWGIGLAEDNPLALNRSTWQGKNWLGETITKVREDLISGNENSTAFELCSNLVNKYRKRK